MARTINLFHVAIACYVERDAKTRKTTRESHTREGWLEA